MNVSKSLLGSIVVAGMAIAIAIAPASRADAVLPEAASCAAATSEQAKWLADQLYRRGEYQRAGECYQAAGDLADANEAFVKAVPAKGDATAKNLQHQGQIAKTLFTGVQQAFRTNH